MKLLQFAAGLLAAAASWSLYAQTLDARANIPFEFRVGAKLMPAGEYLIHHDAGVLTLQGSGGGHASAVAITHTTDLQSNKAVVQFNRYGDVYFFDKVSIPGSAAAWAVSKTPREKELARRINPGQTTVAFESK